MKLKFLKVKNRLSCVTMKVEAEVDGQKYTQKFNVPYSKMESGEYKDVLKNYFEKVANRSEKIMVQATKLEGTTLEV